MSDIMEEDQLLLQIDQFRDKAMQLTKLINNRERRVKELEALVRAKEEKNKELQITLQKKQEEADSLVLDVNNKDDNIMEQVKATMGNLEQKIVDQASSSEEKVQEQQAAVKETMDSMTAGLGTIKDELSEKVHSENVKVYRNIQDLLKEMNKRDEDNARIDKQFRSLRITNVFLMLLSILNVGAVSVIILFLLGVLH